jgi:thioredoxin-like negative regulator of GroEL
MKTERNWGENKAQKLLLSIFEKLGSVNSLVIDGRKKMQRILY